MYACMYVYVYVYVCVCVCIYIYIYHKLDHVNPLTKPLKKRTIERKKVHKWQQNKRIATIFQFF
jgi:hypothetical protein